MFALNAVIGTTQFSMQKTTKEMKNFVKHFRMQQENIFQFVYSWLKISSQGEKVTCPLLIVHGSGGTRKTHLIQDTTFFAVKALSRGESYFKKYFVGLFALTGVASFNLVGGMVIDSAFSTMRDKPTQYLTQLSAVRLGELRSTWLQVKLIFNNEISMMSPERLAHLHQRLCKIKDLRHRGIEIELFAGVETSNSCGSVLDRPNSSIRHQQKESEQRPQKRSFSQTET